MIEAKNVDFYYGDFHALKNISMTMESNTVTAFIGPSGCGKSTFLRLFNRMNDLIPGTRLTGEFRIVVQIGLAGLLELREHQPPHLADLLAQERQLFFRMFHCPGRCALSG